MADVVRDLGHAYAMLKKERANVRVGKSSITLRLVRSQWTSEYVGMNVPSKERG